MKSSRTLAELHPAAVHLVLFLNFAIVTGVLPPCPRTTPQRVQVKCAEFSFHHKYRTYDGSCNNFKHPQWGAAGTPLLRLLPAQYEDASDIPIGRLDLRGKSRGFPLPNPRKVSQAIMAAKKDIEQDLRHTAMLAHWGQFVAHDLTLAKEADDNCTEKTEDQEVCFNIRIPADDFKLPPRSLFFPFKRTVSCSDGGLREQMNQLTSYVDASQVYGSGKLVAYRLRERFPADLGKLSENPNYRSPDGKAFMPFDSVGDMTCFRNVSKRNGMDCFMAGDVRANEQLMLTTLHTVFLREHNRIAEKLRTTNPEWNGETIFQESRKLVGAITQKITYDEWLPKILGPLGMTMLGSYEGYDESVNAGLANGVATGALRFGHALVPPALKRLGRAFRQDVSNGDAQLRGAFFAPESLVKNGGLDPLIRGAVGAAVKDIKPQSLVNEELTDHLFPNAHPFPLDLAAMNIQRGRDHALPPYNEWRQLCGLPKIRNWDQLKTESRDARFVDKVKDLYGQPDSIDLWVGGLLEKPLRGGKLGRTFSCLLADQFKRLRQGDRFWYENPGVFGLSQVETIRQYSLSKVLCHNMDRQTWMPRDSFVYYPKGLSQYFSCDQLTDLNLNLWRIDGDGLAGTIECSSPDCICRYQLGSWADCNPATNRQRRTDFLIHGEYPPCTSERRVSRFCEISDQRNSDRRQGKRDERKNDPKTTFSGDSPRRINTNEEIFRRRQEFFNQRARLSQNSG